MKITDKIIFALATACALSACSKDEIDTYNEGEDAVRFVSADVLPAERAVGGSAYSVDDDILYETFSFLDAPDAKYHDCDIRLALIGKTAGQDREVSVSTEGTTAPDTTYQILKAVIPADSIYGYVRVRLYNVAELSDSTYKLSLTIQGNDKLVAGPKEYLKSQLSWNNQIPAPSASNYIRTYNMLVSGMRNFVSTSLAAYSPNALRAIVAATGWNDWDDYSVHGAKFNRDGYKYLPRYSWIYVDNSYKGYAAKLADWLKKYEQEHGAPLLHDAGALKGQPVQARTF